MPSLPSPGALSLALALASCGGGSSSVSTGEPPVGDTTAPFTQADPVGGLYPAGQTVTLTSNESATVYYTTDGSVPAPGGVTTLSGPSPVPVAVTHDLDLKFFGIDAEGNVEVVQTEAYTFDTNPPIVLLGGGLPSTLAFLERGTVTFSVDELESSELAWSAELGGTATPGTGTQIAAGVTPPSTLTQFQVDGWRLPLGSSTTLHLFVLDGAGGLGFQPIPLSGLADEVIALAGESGDLAITPGGDFLYIARPQEGRVLKYGARPGTPNFHQQLASINVGSQPSGLRITPDGTRVYVTCAQSFYELDVASDAPFGPIATPGNVAPSGADMTVDGSRLYFAADDGRLRFMNTDPLSGGFRGFNSLSPQESLMELGEVAIAPSGTAGVLSWTGAGQYGVVYFDTDPGTLNFLATLVTVSNQPLNRAAVVISQDGTRAWLGDSSGKLARAALNGSSSAIQTFNQVLSASGVTPAPDESLLLLSGGGLAGLRLADPDTLELVGSVASGDGTGDGTGRDLAFSPDGKRAYLVRNQGGPNAEIQMLRVQP